MTGGRNKIIKIIIKKNPSRRSAGVRGKKKSDRRGQYGGKFGTFYAMVGRKVPQEVRSFGAFKQMGKHSAFSEIIAWRGGVW